MDDVRGWGGGERRQGGGERLPGLLEVSSRLSIVEGVGDGSYCTSRDGGAGEGAAFCCGIRASRRDRGKQAQMIDAKRS
jgi:hypothetical protein